jgi:uracil-DNA glycosylase family 4
MELPVRPPSDFRGVSDPGCELCELHEYANSVCVPSVHYPASLDIDDIDAHYTILFVGQNPGFYEDKANEPFVGKSGRVVKDVYIGGCSLQTKAKIWFTNGVRCHTEANETPKPRHFAACKTYLQEDLATTVGDTYDLIMVTLGAPATRAVWKHFGNETNVGLNEAFNRNGQLISNTTAYKNDWPSFRIFSTYHPAAVLRNNNYINAVSSHMQLVSDYIDGVMAEPSDPDIVPTRSPRKE